MEILVIIAFVIVLSILNNTQAIRKLKQKYYVLIALLVFPALFYFTVYKDYNVWKLAAFLVVVGASIYSYSLQKKRA